MESATGTDFPDKSATLFSENRVGGAGGKKIIEFGPGNAPFNMQKVYVISILFGEGISNYLQFNAI